MGGGSKGERRRCWVNLIVGFWVSASRRHWVLARRRELPGGLHAGGGSGKSWWNGWLGKEGRTIRRRSVPTPAVPLLPCTIRLCHPCKVPPFSLSLCSLPLLPYHILFSLAFLSLAPIFHLLPLIFTFTA